MNPVNPGILESNIREPNDFRDSSIQRFPISRIKDEG